MFTSYLSPSSPCMNHLHSLSLSLFLIKPEKFCRLLTLTSETFAFYFLIRDMNSFNLKSLLITCALLICSFIPILCLAGDSEILIRVKNTGLDDPDGKLKNWVVNDDHNPCNWTGITCDSNKHSVISINLSHTNIYGEFPSGFCRIRSLRNLYLADNNINGSLSSESLSLCSHLHELDLSFNLIFGQLPEFTPEFSELKFLDLSYNNFTGDIPASFGRFPALKVLNLSNNFFNRSIPSFLGNISELTQLLLGYTSFKPSPLPPEIGNLTKLEVLWLASTNLNGNIPDSVGNLVSLKNLDLSTNLLSGKIPETIGGLRSVEQIEFYQNQLSGELPESLGNLSTLRNFDISQNGFTGKLPDKIAGLNFESLNLNDNLFEGEVPESLARSPNLWQLKLFNNSFSGRLPENLGRYSNLEDLDVSTNNFSGELPKYLCFRKKLERLVAFNNKFSGNLPDTVVNCDSLNYIRIEHNEHSGELPAKFWAKPLTLLQLNGNHFEGSVSASIAVASEITELTISNNKFSGVIPTVICKLRNLKTLDVSRNLFSGDIPSCLTELKELQKLRMQENMFTGTIPSSAGSWMDLTELNLSKNQLSGKIPPELGDKPVLNYLDLSVNTLKGEIPADLSKLKLNQFNVSNNNLQGKVPLGFNYHLYISSLLGNPNLCSPNLKPLSQCPKTRPATLYVVIVLSICAALLIGSLSWHFKKRSESFGGKSKRLHKVTTFQRIGFNEEEVTGSLTEENIIGTGGSGLVYKVKLKSGQIVAVKKLLGGNRKPDSYAIFRSEVETLGGIRHGNIVKLLFSCSGEDFRILGYEYMENGSLGNVLHGEKSGGLLDWPKRFKIAVGSAKGLAYLHHDCMPAIVHRDVKSNNILLDVDFNPRVSDFGLARILQQDVEEEDFAMSRIAGSYGYIAPGKIYSFIVTFFFLTTLA